MHCLLDETVKDSGNSQHPCAASRFRNFHFPHRLRVVGSRQQFFFDARPLLLQVAFQDRYRHFINSGRAFVGYYTRVCRHHIAATDDLLHQSRCRFRPVSCFPSRDVCRTNPGTSRFPTATFRDGTEHLNPVFCCSCRHRNSGSCPFTSCSALCRLVTPTPMASADFCQPITTPLDASSTRQDDSPPRVIRVTFIPYTRRIYSHILLNGYRALKIYAFSPGCDCLICDSCSSGQDFACRFLQIPPRD